MASQPIYQFYAELGDYEPKIWRRFQVMNNVTMSRLSYIIMTLFEMQASHLFGLEVPLGSNYYRHRSAGLSKDEQKKLLSYCDVHEVLRFELPNEMTAELQDENTKDAAVEKLSYSITWVGDQLSLCYDYGDSWEVRLVLEQIIEDKSLPGKDLPRVIAGEGYGIIEDCGGVGGLEDIATAFAEKKGEMYQEYSDWLGTDTLDLTTFDIDDMNFRLKKVPRIYSDIYEYRIAPTKQSINILERNYKLAQPQEK